MIRQHLVETAVAFLLVAGVVMASWAQTPTLDPKEQARVDKCLGDYSHRVWAVEKVTIFTEYSWWHHSNACADVPTSECILSLSEAVLMWTCGAVSYPDVTQPLFGTPTPTPTPVPTPTTEEDL